MEINSSCHYLLLIITLGYVVHHTQAIDDVVTVTGGAILGVRDPAIGVRFWKGIPFGANTAGVNRFLPPSPAANWSSVLNCTMFGPGCYSNQDDLDTAPVQSEDCLNLNVYAPLTSSLQPGAALPVMFFIHGGGFNEGFNAGPFKMYDGSYVAVTGNVVVVTVNYRLGAFGFLVTDKLNGNLGLMDQRLAMHWVQQNIHVFGGDPKQITIWGESAGAMSVGVHLVSPKSRGLFTKAIMQSPVAILYEEKKNARLYGADFCKIIGCGGDACNSTCLQSATITPKLILNAWSKAAKSATIFFKANWGHLADGLLQFIPTCCDEDVSEMKLFN